MKIEGNGVAVELKRLGETTVKVGSRRYPALSLTLDGGITAEERAALAGGELTYGEMQYKGYTSEEGLHLVLYKVETEEGRITELEEELAEEQKAHKASRATLEKARGVILEADDATASKCPELFPEMVYDGHLIEAGMRINHGGVLYVAGLDLWDTEENNPENAPDLWKKLNYRDGYRIIPDVIAVTDAFAAGEKGWWKDELYRSKVDSNVYTPEQYADNWEKEAAT